MGEGVSTLLAEHHRRRSRARSRGTRENETNRSAAERREEARHLIYSHSLIKAGTLDEKRFGFNERRKMHHY